VGKEAQKMKFQRKPEFIEAIQWDGTDKSIIAIERMQGVKAERSSTTEDVLYVSYSGGAIRVELDEWVVKGSVYPLLNKTLKEEYDSTDD
jgi:hypothetical protein